MMGKERPSFLHARLGIVAQYRFETMSRCGVYRSRSKSLNSPESPPNLGVIEAPPIQFSA